MNTTVYTAQITASHRAAQLDRENEILRAQSARRTSAEATRRPTGFAVITRWATSRLHISAPRLAH